jgi:hypothetical protein
MKKLKVYLWEQTLQLEFLDTINENEYEVIWVITAADKTSWSLDKKK